MKTLLQKKNLDTPDLYETSSSGTDNSLADCDIDQEGFSDVAGLLPTSCVSSLSGYLLLRYPMEIRFEVEDYNTIITLWPVIES